MKGKKRPDAERAGALVLVAALGVSDASEESGIPQSTLYQWAATPEFVELRDRTREKAVEEMWGIIQLGFRRVGHLLATEQDTQRAATATAIVTDKMLLLGGEPTSIERLNLIEGMDDHERTVLSDAIRGELARRADQHTAEAAVGATGPTGPEAPNW